jgi:hypothetical protein
LDPRAFLPLIVMHVLMIVVIIRKGLQTHGRDRGCEQKRTYGVCFHDRS